jgi:hypothetical protein
MARTYTSRLIAALLEVAENATNHTERLRALEYILVAQGKLKPRLQGPKKAQTETASSELPEAIRAIISKPRTKWGDPR